MTTHAETGGRPGNRWTPLIWSVAAGLILLPFVAMQFTREVRWTATDFVFAAVMIGGSCVVLELALRLTRNWAYRGGVVLALAAIFLLVWINGAVGIIGNEGNPLNLLYGCVIMTAIGGAMGAGFRAAGMARGMAAAAVVMLLIGMFVVTSGRTDPPGAIDYVAIHLFFAMIFAGSALLFRKAAREQS
ncbi:hypothetical protein [Sphingomonas bacterium]|uniref:hypothetical protein n=1 Tax=Sphingomonas bacterium TaxID=1895847 RepID=UPI0026339712|nr:hypothetical protein [Sphingomonas bacterium]MDB5678749.1 hypothetical protein [Sphingomonas bacterium]